MGLFGVKVWDVRGEEFGILYKDCRLILCLFRLFVWDMVGVWNWVFSGLL